MSDVFKKRLRYTKCVADSHRIYSRIYILEDGSMNCQENDFFFKMKEINVG